MRRCVFAGRVLLLGLLSYLLSACGWLNETFPDRNRDYQTAEPASALEVPPDLTTTTVTDALVVPSSSTTLSGYTSARDTLSTSGTPVLPGQEALSFRRHGDRAWLVVQGEPEAVWTEAREFWLENGFLIMREDPATGILETDWKENRAAIPQGPIRSLIGRVMEQAYSSAYRDRYRMRLERGEKTGTTELFITHQGVEEILVSGGEEGTTKWGPRPQDPGMESEMLKRMMVFLGVQPDRVERMMAEQEPARVRAELIQQESGQATLVLHDDYSESWRNVGIVLDRVDFAVEDRDRLQGIYYVRYNDPLKGQKKGFLSGLAFWSDDDEGAKRYQIKLSDDGADTRAVVLNADGQPETSVTGVRILTLLYEELK